MTFIRKAALALAAMVLIALPVALAVTSDAALAASAKQEVCKGVGITGGTSGCRAPDGTPTVEGVVRVVIQLLSVIAGIAAVIMLIIAGIRYITSGGDAGGVKGAKEAIIYAIVGLVVVALSQAIVIFVLNKL